MIGIGIDNVDLDRFRRVLARRPSVAGRLFTERERADLAGRADAVPGLAARFAAKEAAMKALGTGLGGIGFGELEVVRAPSGAPGLVVTGRAAALAGALGVERFHVSLTHSDTLATAVVVAA